eukprot:scaffold316865_cov14-Tisochrysis_lutea.AAC.1
MKKANAFKNAKRNAGNGSNGGRRLLADPPATEAKTTDGLRETLKTLESRIMMGSGSSWSHSSSDAE